MWSCVDLLPVTPLKRTKLGITLIFSMSISLHTVETNSLSLPGIMEHFLQILASVFSIDKITKHSPASSRSSWNILEYNLHFRPRFLSDIVNNGLFQGLCPHAGVLNTRTSPTMSTVLSNPTRAVTRLHHTINNSNQQGRQIIEGVSSARIHY